jgi:antitoxin component YwqK of YwqJK toxin-antitoxin module
MVSFSYPLLLIRNNEPVTGIVYSIWPNGNVGTEKHYKNGLPGRHEKGYWSNGKLGNIIKYYSKQKIGYRTPKKEKEWFENGSFKSKEKNYYWGENGHFLLRKSRYPNGNLENKTRKWSNRKRYNLKEKLWHSNGQLKRILNSSRETCWDEEGNKIECD